MSAAEEIRWRQWLRSLNAQPAEVNGDDQWNHDTIAATWDHVTGPLEGITMDELTYTTADLGRVAADIDQGAAVLRADAGKHDAATAAERYAERLRGEIAGRAADATVEAAKVAAAEKVALAANLGGILIDGKRLDDAALANPLHSDDLKAAIRSLAAEKRAAIEGSGAFRHVADEGQVPFWRLSTETDEM